MLTKTVQFEDYNGDNQVEKLYFNLTKTEMMDLIELQPRLEAWAERTSGNARDLTNSEIKELLEIIKLLIEASYGVRSDDGKHFRKSPELFDDFKQSAVYDAFVFGMFLNPEEATDFMIGIMPKGIADEALTQAKLDSRQGPTIVDAELPQPENELNATEMEVPAYIREDREPTKAELGKMNAEELRMAFQRKMSKQ